jgi:hypothetical protein
LAQQDQPDGDQAAVVEQRREVAADQGDEAVVGVLAQLLGRQPGEGRLGIEARHGQQDPDHDLAQPQDGLVGHDGHPEGAPESSLVLVRACLAHRVGPLA